jgi:branched-chain amino acid transport system substrate-binding protein
LLVFCRAELTRGSARCVIAAQAVGKVATRVRGRPSVAAMARRTPGAAGPLSGPMIARELRLARQGICLRPLSRDRAKVPKKARKSRFFGIYKYLASHLILAIVAAFGASCHCRMRSETNHTRAGAMRRTQAATRVERGRLDPIRRTVSTRRGETMSNVTSRLSRRSVLKAAGATATLAGVGGLPRVAFAVPKTIKIGLVMPSTGPLAFFCEHIPFTLKQINQTLGGKIKINGTEHPYEIIVKDSQSSPNRAAEVTQELILKDKVDLVSAFATPETVNPVSDQCEANGVPCITNDAPLEPYFFGRKGDPKKGFDWTYHFFFSGAEVVNGMAAYFSRLSTNKKIGGIWPNDGDGIAQSDKERGFPPVFIKNGFTVIDPGRFDMPASNYNAQIAAFKAADVEIVTGVVPPPEFTTFWNGAAQQGFKPKICYMGKALEFPPAINALGDRALGLTTEVWWSKFHPYSSGLDGQTSAQLADAYEKDSNRQWSLPLGFRHALFEVIFDVLKRSQKLDDPASIRDAIKATDYKSIVGPINFNKGPFPNCAETPLVVGQWEKGKKYPYEMVIVDNSIAKDIPVGGEPHIIKYT